ncbi:MULTISPECIES: type II toxin-antitoxin system RelE/ParE family toxin [Pseudomonas]|nr:MULTISPECIES: type II toxin-antitoxin system RelE/ParE family toxin [Pseudomonas]
METLKYLLSRHLADVQNFFSNILGMRLRGYSLGGILMGWSIGMCREFNYELQVLTEVVQDELLAQLHLLKHFGPALGRPHVDTLKGSRHSNMKELRFNADGGVWRVAFAFDRSRSALLLVAGDKAGINERRFYGSLITRADERFDRHLSRG